MTEKNKTLAELHATRAQLYRELKDLPLEERLRRLCQMGKAAMKKHGLKLKYTERVKAAMR